MLRQNFSCGSQIFGHVFARQRFLFWYISLRWLWIHFREIMSTQLRLRKYNKAHARSQTCWIFRDFKAPHTLTIVKFDLKKIKVWFFFQWKLRCCFFQILNSGGPQGAWGFAILIWNFCLSGFFSKYQVVSNQNSQAWGPLSWGFEKYSISAFTGKKSWFYLF